MEVSEIGFQVLIKAFSLPAKKDFSLQHSVLADSYHRNSISHCALLAGMGGAMGIDAFSVLCTILYITCNLEICAMI